MNVILLCAGFGTRLYPLTRDRPKPLLPVAGKPIVEHLLEQLYRTGVVDSVLLVSNQRFHQAFENWSDGRVTVLNDGAASNDARLGAAGDLALAVKQSRLVGPSVVAAGDNLYRMSFDALFSDYHSRPRNLILRYRETDPEKLRRTGVAEIDDDGRLLHLSEKPAQPPSEWACPAFYLLEPEALAAIESFLEECPGADAIGSFIGWLAERLPVYTHEMEGARWDIGDLEGYRAAETWLAQPAVGPSRHQNRGPTARRAGVSATIQRRLEKGRTMTKKNVDLDDLKATAERVWLAGLGALAEAEKHGDKLFQSLVERGKSFDDILPQAGEAVRESVDSAKEQATAAFREVESRFDKQVKSAMQRAGVARQADVDALKREVARLKVERAGGTSKSRAKKKTAKK